MTTSKCRAETNLTKNSSFKLFPRIQAFLTTPAVAYLLSCIVVFAVHWTSLKGGFIWLDHGDIEDGRAVYPLSQWFDIFNKPFAATGFYRPLVALAHSVDAALWKTWAPGFHTTNLILHCLASCAAPLFVGCFLPLTVLEQCVIIFLFGLHPVGILPSGCISFRSEPLMVIFVFLSLYSYRKTRETKSPWWLSVFGVSVSFACFSKETSFFYLPLFILMWELSRLWREQSAKPLESLKNQFPALITFFLVLAAVLALRTHALAAVWRIHQTSLPLSEAIGTRFVVYGRELINLVSPFEPRFSDAASVVGFFHPASIAVAAFLGAGLWFVFRYKYTHAAILLALIVMSLAPALNILPLPRFYSPHYAYCAVAPIAGFAIMAIRKVIRLPLGRIAVPVVGLTWMIVAAVSTTIAGSRMESDLTMFGHEVSRDNHFLEGWFYIGNALADKGDNKEAWKAYEQGLKINPGILAFVDKPGVLINQSAIALRQNDLTAADSLLVIAASAAPAQLLPDLAYDRAFIAARRGDDDSVIALLDGKDEILRRKESCFLLANALIHRGREQDAQFVYERGEKTGE